MLKFLNKKKDNKGFSLVELIIVVAIMAILVGLLAPQYIKYVEKSRKSTDASNLSELVNALQVYAADSEANLPADTYTITISTSKTEIKAGVSGNQTVAENAIEATAPDYATIRLKSNKWKENDNDTSGATSITAAVTVDNNGGTTVEYTPKELNSFIKGATTAQQ